MRSIRILIFASLISSCQDLSEQESKVFIKEAVESIELSNKNQEISFLDQYQIHTNIWGQLEEGESLPLVGLDTFSVNHQRRIAWKWDIQNRDQSKIVAYPEIIYGWKPWMPNSTSVSLPQPLSNIQTISSSYDLESKAQGHYNLAYDLWITNQKNAEVEHITAEIMIWQSWESLRPLGKKLNTIDTPFGTYEFWKGKTSDDWDYFAFRSLKAQWEANLEIKWFTDFLIKNQHLQPDDFLASVEFGNEISSGVGQTIIHSFNIEVQ